MLSELDAATASEVPAPSWRWYAFGLAALAIGAVLRLAWGGDIEFKFDESYMFQRAVNAGETEPFPLVGMRSGAGVANPGPSVWIFIAAARLFEIQTPPQLARVVQISNVVALTLSMVFGFAMVGREKWKTWTWAVALACVNPFSVLFDRKIWAQSSLPLFSTLFVIGWWKRDTRWGAFIWGLIGAWVGQIHLSGFFFAASILIWTVIGDRSAARDRRRSVHWLSWSAGSALGALTLLPWIAHLATHGVSAREHDYLGVLILHNFFGLWYWILWATGALGLGMSYSLGIPEFFAFLKYPILVGKPTYLIGLAHAIAFALGTWLLLRRAWPTGERRVVWQRAILAHDESTQRLVSAGFFGCGLLLVAAGFPIHRHYLIVTFPLQWLWLSQHARRATRHWNYVLALIWICELIISVGFLHYIHVHGGALTGDYGATFMHQR